MWGDVTAWITEHGVAVGALLAALRAMARARALRDSAAAEAIRKLGSVLEATEKRLAATEGRERACVWRCAELEERCSVTERRGEALAAELEDLRRALGSDGR